MTEGVKRKKREGKTGEGREEKKEDRKGGVRERARKEREKRREGGRGVEEGAGKGGG